MTHLQLSHQQQYSIHFGIPEFRPDLCMLLALVSKFNNIKEHRPVNCRIVTYSLSINATSVPFYEISVKICVKKCKEKYHTRIFNKNNMLQL